MRRQSNRRPLRRRVRTRSFFEWGMPAQRIIRALPSQTEHVMHVRLGGRLVALMVVCGIAQAALAQKPPARPPKRNPLLKLTEPWPEEDVVQARRAESDTRRLFKEIEPLAFTLTADFGAINKDRNPESTTRFPAVLSVPGESGADRNIAVKLGTRG